MNTTQWSSFNWFSPLAEFPGMKTLWVAKLAKLNLHTVGDLLLHFPYRYEDHTRLTPIRHLQENAYALIEGEIIAVKPLGRQKKRYCLTLREASASCNVIFFHSFPVQRAQWKVGGRLRAFGQAKWGSHGFEMTHPEWKIIDPTIVTPLPMHLTPIYPTVAGLAQKTLRRFIARALQAFQSNSTETIDSFVTLSEEYSWQEALQCVHAPLPDRDLEKLNQKLHPAYRRLAMEELAAHQFTLRQLRESARMALSPGLTVSDEVLHLFLSRLPFSLTESQQQAWDAIRHDLSQTRPMLRLLQGDVGCGKTIVAALAALAAVQSGYQVALMVPTEILAEQHFSHFTEWFEPFGIPCMVLTGKLKAKERREVHVRIMENQAAIIIGTHALFQHNQEYPTLGLMIIDEQHRFGVNQRLALRDKGAPHQLMMTATPIPRTLAMSQCAHLDFSSITTLPPGRKPIETCVVPQTRRAEIIDRIRGVCEKRQQVYWVCTLITESETLQCQAAEITYAQLQATLKDQKIGLVHGKLHASEKEAIMQQFYSGEIDLLVATTVIEVGVNVPNATLMVIENPERLGLAQLHQLRGRVGRGAQASYCILLYQSPLSEMAKARLGVLRDSQDGFVIAEADLRLRGAGEILGTRQTGERQFRVLDLQRDRELIETMPEWILAFEQLSPQANETIIKRWLRRPDYATL